MKPDVDKLIAVAVVNRHVRSHLLKRNPEAAARLVGVDLTPEEVVGLKSITAPKLSGFAEACILLGLVSGRVHLER